jgi:hypothetical protein
MTVRELLARVDSAELAEWAAYYQLEPFGEGMQDQRHGMLSALIANTNRDPKTRPEPFEPHEFIPWRKRGKAAEPRMAGSAEAQTNLLKQSLFGKVAAGTEKKKRGSAKGA